MWDLLRGALRDVGGHARRDVGPCAPRDVSRFGNCGRVLSGAGDVRVPGASGALDPGPCGWGKASPVDEGGALVPRCSQVPPVASLPRRRRRAAHIWRQVLGEGWVQGVGGGVGG